MSTSNNILPKYLAAGSTQVTSPEKPINKPSGGRRLTSEGWHKKAQAGMNDPTKNIPKGW
jgi:hypothetical protein